jgi:integrase
MWQNERSTLDPCPPLGDDPAAPVRYARWGDQLDVRNITRTRSNGESGELSAEQVAAYLAKYATKATESFGTRLDHRTTADDLADLDRQLPAHIAALVRAAWELGDRPGLVPRNVADLVDPPRMPRYEHAAFTPEQAERFLAAIRGDRLEALFVLALVTGLREGELLGLRWSDVDLDAATVTVRGSMQPDDRGRRVIEETKTRSSRRLVVLPRLAVAALLSHRTVQARERLRAGPRWQELGLVFPNTVGRAILPQNLLQRSLYPLLERAELPRLRFHDLRHSAATLLLARGVHPKVVSELLGHTQIGITLDLYSHESATMLRHAADAFDELFGGQLGGQAGSVEDKAADQPS